MLSLYFLHFYASKTLFLLFLNELYFMSDLISYLINPRFKQSLYLTAKKFMQKLAKKFQFKNEQKCFKTLLKELFLSCTCKS